MIKENSVLGYKPVCPKKTSRGKRIDRIEFYYTYNLYSTKLLHINKKRYLICYSKARLFCCETLKKKSARFFKNTSCYIVNTSFFS